MRLLHAKKVELKEFGGNEVPRYAILSHTWGKEEVTLQDMNTNIAMILDGYEKVKKACSVAAADGFEYVWIDTCCIDKTSSAELSEALNSMYRWYQEAEECYAYLADVPPGTVNRLTGIMGPGFLESKWFTRGWTLQELIAPSSIIFLDKEWQEIGTKSNLHQVISEITGIPTGFLLGDDIGYASIAQRMSWASKRKTTRNEDLAYCLMGLFGIYMPMLYGEGERAFIRLQEEIMKVSDDHSLFAWSSKEDHGGILATSPAAFADSGNIIPTNPSYTTTSPSTLSGRGIHLSLPFQINSQQRPGLAILHCTEVQKESMRLAIRLRDVFPSKEDFIREQSSTLELVHLHNIKPSQYPLTSLYVRKCRLIRNRKWEDMEKCIIKLEGVEAKDIPLYISNLDSNWELYDGVMVMNIVAIPDGILGRLVVMTKDGNMFQILLNKRGRFLSANISTCSNSDLRVSQGPVVPEKENYDQDRVVKALGDGQHVHVAIKKRVLLLREQNCRAGVMEISYSSTLRGVWLEHIAVLGRDICEETLLSYAVRRGLAAVVRLLIEKGAELESKDREGRTPLSWAAVNGHEDVVRLLLERGAEFELKDSKGRTPLSWAAENGHKGVVWLLLEKGAELESKDRESQTPLSWAARNGHEAIVQLFLKSTKLQSKDGGYSRTPLLWAAKKLLLKGGELESKDNEWGQVPLSWAARNGHEAVVRRLLEKGADLESKDGKCGTSPLSWAAMNGHEAVVRRLLEKGADLESQDSQWGRTPLSWAAVNGHEAMVRLLLENGAKLESKDSWIGRAPLSWAARNGHEAVVRLLLEKGADLESKDSQWGRTPLTWAAKNGHEAVVQLLAEKEAELNSKDSQWGRTPLS